MVVYECEYTVDSRDIDPWYHCRPSGLMGMLQEAATQAACALHVSRDEMLEPVSYTHLTLPTIA